MTKSYKGSCLCGSVKFTIKNQLLNKTIFCHCKQCRKNYGLYGAFVGVPKSALSLKGEKNITWYKSSPKVRRGFCKKCGSPIFWEYKNSAHTNILPGLLDNLKTTKGLHLFTKDKGGYYELGDKLPKFKTFPK